MEKGDKATFLLEDGT